MGIDCRLGSCLGVWAATVTCTIPYRASFDAVHSLQRVFLKPQCPGLDSTGFPRGRKNYMVTAWWVPELRGKQMTGPGSLRLVVVKGGKD